MNNLRIAFAALETIMGEDVWHMADGRRRNYKTNGFTDLVVERHGTNLVLAQYREDKDLIDQKMTILFDVEDRRVVVREYRNTYSHKQGGDEDSIEILEHFLSVWISNLRSQGFSSTNYVEFGPA